MHKNVTTGLAIGADNDRLIELLLRTTPDVVVLKDAEGRWRLANERAIQLFLLAGTPYIGKTDEELGVLVPALAEAFGFCAETDWATWGEGRRCVYEEPVPQPGRDTVILETIKTPLFHPDGSRQGILLVGRDITDRKRAEQEIIRQTVQLEKAEEMDQLKTNLVNAVSHELRTPMTTIKGYAEFLEDDVEGTLTATQQEYVRHIQVSTQRLQSLVDDLLDFARIEAGTLRLNLQESDIEQLVRDTVCGFRPQAGLKQIDMRIELDLEQRTVVSDPIRMGQVLINLIGNALKFTPPGGRITVRAASGAHGVRFEIEDTGIGIAREHQPNLFQKFYQVDPSLTRSSGGAGLGLSISKALVLAHGGAIGVESEAGRGSTFWVTLPDQPLTCG